MISLTIWWRDTLPSGKLQFTKKKLVSEKLKRTTLLLLPELETEHDTKSLNICWSFRWANTHIYIPGTLSSEISSYSDFAACLWRHFAKRYVQILASYFALENIPPGILSVSCNPIMNTSGVSRELPKGNNQRLRSRSSEGSIPSRFQVATVILISSVCENWSFNLSSYSLMIERVLPA